MLRRDIYYLFIGESQPLGFMLLQLMGVSNEVLYNASPYASSWGNPLIRAVQLATSAGWLGLLLAFAPDSSVRLVTRAGQNTMPVFLLHGFIARGLSVLPFALPCGPAGVACAVMLAAGIVFALAHPQLNDLMRFRKPQFQRQPERKY